MPRKPVEYAHSLEVRIIAQVLIQYFHPHLYGSRIEYVFVSEPPKGMGRELSGRARKVNGLYAFLATPDFEGEPESFFCIEITRPKWDVRPLAWRVALVDHELKHCDYDDEFDDSTLVGHDEEEFDDIVERHGAWNEGLENFLKKLLNGSEQREKMKTVLVEIERRLKEGNFEGVTRRAVRTKTKDTPARIDLRRSVH